MPNYTFLDKTTGEETTLFMTVSELDEFKKANPDLEQQLAAPGIVSGYHLKPDAGFRDVLKKIKKNNIRSNINTF